MCIIYMYRNVCFLSSSSLPPSLSPSQGCPKRWTRMQGSVADVLRKPIRDEVIEDPLEVCVHVYIVMSTADSITDN